MKKTILFFCFLFAFTSISAKANTDSLLARWNNTSLPDTARLDAVAEIAKSLCFSMPDSCRHYTQLQYDFAKKNNLPSYMGNALNIKGVSFIIEGKADRAIAQYVPSLDLYKKGNKPFGVAAALDNIANAYHTKADYEQSLHYRKKSIAMRKKHDDKKGLANSLNNLGLLYDLQGDYANAISYYTQSLSISEKANDTQGMARTLNNIGGIYTGQKEYKKANEYQQRSLEIKQKAGNLKGVVNSLVNIGTNYKNLKELEKAKEIFIQGLEIASKNNFHKEKADCVLNLGSIAETIGLVDTAIYRYKKSMKIYQIVNHTMGVARSNCNLAQLYMQKGNNNLAIKHGKNALKLAKQNNLALEKRDAAHILYLCYKAENKPLLSLQMHELYIQQRDTMEREENKTEIIKQQYKYDYQKKEELEKIKHVEELRAQERIALAEKKKQNAILISVLGGLGLVILFSFFLYKRYRESQKQKHIIQLQKDTVELQKREIVDSIGYARRIQDAILPSTKVVKEYLEQSFIFYKPKDIVSGDFYWIETIGDNVLFAAADCTGHGVPGAMVSVVCHNALNRSVLEFGLHTPGKILTKARELVVENFKASDEEVRDGMDIALCSFNKSNQKLQFAGAFNPIWVIRNQAAEVEEIKGDKQPIGKYVGEKPFNTIDISLNKSDTIYIFSDGFQDQFGGVKGKKYKAGALKSFLLSIQSKDMAEQHQLLAREFENWKGDLEQIDDVCVIGVRI